MTAAATVGRLAAALHNRRTMRGWSQAMLARQSGVGQHTIGRIEAGRTWPDLATVARLAQVLGMAVTMGSAGTGPVGDAVPAAPGTPAAAGVAGGPLRLGGAGVSAAQAIDLLFAHDPRLASEVAALAQTRRRTAYTAAAAGAARAAGARA
ncbi:helix-turn-helix transcriptional regulator [Terrabacter aerolatus]|uniref:helix-turn-helix transcriptional regulator n=1 Tax=Terrabacter aerolatus TaxID=422442 RepID=UPI0011BF016E|nr:helix-turn-helix transcriptional regulator [Terrabacter aerolatus]